MLLLNVILQLYYIRIASGYKQNISKAHVLIGLSHLISYSTYWKNDISKYVKHFCWVFGFEVAGAGGQQTFLEGELLFKFILFTFLDIFP